MKTPMKYAVWGALGGTAAVFTMRLVGHQSTSPEGIIFGCMLGGLIGGIIRDRRGKK